MSRKGYPSDKQDQFVLRLPEGMRDRIKAAAEANARSMNAEIIHRLEATFDPSVGTMGFLSAALDATVPRTNQQTLLVILDANGVPQNWDETFEHLRAIRKAGAFSPSVINTLVYNGPRVSAATREEEAEQLARWYRNYLRKHPSRSDAPTDDN